MQIQAKVERPSYCFIVDFCLPPYHSLSDINSPCLPTVLSILPSFSNSPKMRSIFSSLISIERRRSVRVMEPPFWAKIQRIRSRWLYGGFFIVVYHASSIMHSSYFTFSKCLFSSWLYPSFGLSRVLQDFISER